MLSIPPRQTLTTLRVFTVWSALMAYFISGVLGVAFPQLMSLVFMLDLSGRYDTGIWRFNSGLLTVIGFLYIVTARSSPAVAGNGALLGSVPERLLFVTSALVWMFRQSLISLPFTAAIGLLDSTLAIVTYVIWSRNTPDASPMKCMGEIAKIMLPPLGPARKWSSNCVQIIGYLQMVVSLAFMVKPEIVRDALGLDTIGGSSKGLVSVLFMQMTVIGWFQVLGGGDGNESCPKAAVFYRIAWSTPLISLLYYFNSIERAFALALGIADSMSALIIFISLCIESLPSKATKWWHRTLIILLTLLHTLKSRATLKMKLKSDRRCCLAE